MCLDSPSSFSLTGADTSARRTVLGLRGPIRAMLGHKWHVAGHSGPHLARAGPLWANDGPSRAIVGLKWPNPGHKNAETCQVRELPIYVSHFSVMKVGVS
jgi:hypothetical protein